MEVYIVKLWYKVGVNFILICEIRVIEKMELIVLDFERK